MRWACAFILLASGLAEAHPIDELVQGAYLTLGPGELRLELDLTPGPQVSAPLLRALDADGDQRISDAEAHSYAARVIGETTVLLDGRPVHLRVDGVDVPPYDMLKLQSGTVRIHAVAAVAPGADAAEHVLVFENRYRPAKSECIANIFRQPVDGWHLQVARQHHSQDGRRLEIEYAAARG